MTDTGRDTKAGQDQGPGRAVALAGPPLTGNRIIDAVLADLAEADQLSVSDQLQRLSAAHEVLAGVLESSRAGAIPMPRPGARPR
ncbi:hypothetical protein [Brooklawnia sp.]|uniref:hypothetical protein n=1 Tax=Brooklawnia sp. TaxID=2699740 RepID=UPI00311D3535